MRSIRTKNSFCSYLIAVRLWHLDGFSSTLFAFANVRVRASSDARKFSELSVRKTLTALLLQAEKLAVTECNMGLTATVPTLGPRLGVLCSFGGCGVLGCVAGEQKWDTGVRSRGYTCLSFCLCLLLHSLRRSEEVLTHVLPTRSLPCWGGLKLEARANLSSRERFFTRKRKVTNMLAKGTKSQ